MEYEDGVVVVIVGGCVFGVIVDMIFSGFD